jgi:hypothetical protein
MSINITHDKLKKLLEYNPETGLFINKVYRSARAKKNTVAGFLSKDGYITIGINGKTYYAHRLAWFYIFEIWPEKFIDHIDTIRNHNWLSNLRECNYSENYQNIIKCQSNNKSGYLGVSSNRSKFRANICLDNKPLYLGSFDTAIEAHEAYLFAKRKIHEFNML